MAYATTNPPVKVAGTIAKSVWHYASEDVHTDVDASGYFTNGDALGMKVNDIVFVVKTTATVGATLHSGFSGNRWWSCYNFTCDSSLIYWAV